MVSLHTNAQPIMSGEPSVVTFFDELCEIGPSLFKEALEFAASKQLQDLKEKATAVGGWSSISDELGLQISKNKVKVGTTYSKQSAKMVKELEYGKGATPPQPLLRKSVFGSSSTSFSDRVSEYMGNFL